MTDREAKNAAKLKIQLSAAGSVVARPSDNSHLDGLMINSAEGVTAFSGFTAEHDPNAEKRLQTRLFRVSQLYPDLSDAYLSTLPEDVVKSATRGRLRLKRPKSD